MNLNPWPVFCRCGAPAVWLVDSGGPRTAGHRAAVACDTCLRAVKKWATRAGHDPPRVVALHPDEAPTLF